MDSRKVQKIGYSTLSVSLPSSWVKEVGLKRGDLLFFMPEKDGSMKLVTSELKPREGIEKFTCNSDQCDPKMLERIIVGSYMLGADIVSIISTTRIRPEHVQEVRGVTRKLLGMGIVEETTDSITLQCSVDPRKFHLDMLLRRLSVLSLTIVKEAVQALQDYDISLAKEAINREDEADTVYMLALRLLINAQRHKEVAEEVGLMRELDILYFGLILRYLELIADYAEDVARRVIELLQRYKNRFPRSVAERLSNLNDLAHDLVLKSVDCFFIGDIKIANSLLEMQTFIELERDRLMQELPDVPHLRSILLDIARIADNGASIALIAINDALGKGKTNVCSRHVVTSF